jgi:hypothetical protein
VAAFERIDLIASDAMAEIVANAVEPDRALADHAFAHRFSRRAGTSILVGSGPLVVAPDLTAGVPSDPATRAGRALALQLLGLMLARGDGLATDQVIVGALPPWLTDEPAPAARAIAEVAVRRQLFPGHPLGFVEPPAGADRSVLWPYVQAAAAVYAGDVALVLRAADFRPDDAARAARAARAASLVSADVALATTPGSLTGVALEHARGMVAVALATLDRLGDQGWRTIAGDPPSGSGRVRRGTRWCGADRAVRSLRGGARLPRLSYPPLTAGRTWTTASAGTAVARSAGDPSTKTLMCGRSRGPASTRRSRIPGTDRSSSTSRAPTVSPSTW